MEVNCSLPASVERVCRKTHSHWIMAFFVGDDAGEIKQVLLNSDTSELLVGRPVDHEQPSKSRAVQAMTVNQQSVIGSHKIPFGISTHLCQKSAANSSTCKWSNFKLYYYSGHWPRTFVPMEGTTNEIDPRTQIHWPWRCCFVRVSNFPLQPD